MNYTMKSGILYEEETSQALATIKSVLMGSTKKIYADNSESSLSTDIRGMDAGQEHSGDVRFKEYVLTDQDQNILALAHPGYADGDDPTVTGWPICRMPRTDHAQILIGDREYLLTMHNSQNYSLKDMHGAEVLKIIHRGISGGWRLEGNHDFTPVLLCGLFTFCRYIEQENEFLIV